MGKERGRKRLDEITTSVVEQIGNKLSVVGLEHLSVVENAHMSVVVAYPGDNAGVVDVGDVMATGGALAVVVLDGEELVGGALLVLELGALRRRDELARDLQVDGELETFEEFLRAAVFVEDEALQVDDEHRWEVFEAYSLECFDLKANINIL